MPRLPDDTALGGRPTPSGQQPVVGIRTGQMAQAVAGLGESVSRMGEEAYAREVKQKDKEDKFSYSQARSYWLKEKVAADTAFDNDQDFATFGTRYQERMAKAQEIAAGMIKSDYDRQLFEQDIEVDLARGMAEIQQKSRAKEADWGVASTVKSNADLRASYLQAKDEATRTQIINSAAENIEGARRRGYLSDVQAAKLNQSTATDFALGRFDMLSYGEQLQTLNNKNDIVHRVVPADVLADRRQRAEAHLRAEADRREAKAQKALYEVDQQIASGIPARPEQWSAWSSKVAGTPLEAEFNQRAQDERQVQEVLRMPIDQQMGYIQQRESELYKTGGTVRDAANLNRLKMAVNQNVKQMQETPLLFSQSRTGVQVAPLDPSALFGDDTGQLADVMTDRAATINAMRKEFGQAVPMRPLLPQEAQSLGAALQKATPTEQVELFQKLYKSIGDQKVYEGAMQQIAPDSPVKAMAGVLAGYAGGQIIETHWLGEDEKVAAKDAASRMLIGESLLNQTKADGKIDGNPVSIPTPSEAQFYEALPDDFRQVFAGRPRAMQSAMQSVRAYYVGRQAETGEFSKDIDPRLMNEAVKSSLGSVAEYAGSPVLLPWGMDETTFRDQIAISISTKNIPESERQLIQRLPVANFGMNSFMVLDDNRRPYLVDGKPMIIEMGSTQ